MRRVWLCFSLGGAVLLLGTTACGDGSTGAPPTYEPPTGVWTYVNEGILSNSCGVDNLYTDPNTEFYLTNNGDGTFTVAQGTDEDFTCTMSAEDFSCPDRLGGTVMPDQLAVTLTWQARIDGSFSSATAMSGVQTISFVCDGDACDLASTVGITFPCAYEYGFSATKQ